LRLHLALGAARMSTWDATVVDSKVTDGVSWSPDAAALIGLAPVEQQQAYLAFLARVHPDERAHLVHYMQRRVDQGAPYQCEYRVLMPDGIGTPLPVAPAVLITAPSRCTVRRTRSLPMQFMHHA
jgi:PAS domain-containing protein